MFLTNTINQFLSRQSNLHNLIILLEVQLLDSILNWHCGSESPSDRTVLRLTDVLTKSILLQTTRSKHIITRIHWGHQITEIWVVVNRNHWRNRNNDSRVFLFGSSDLLELIRMPISIESEFHPILVLHVPVMDLLTRINEILKTSLELFSHHITTSTLHGSAPLAQITQITILITSEIRMFISGIWRISRLSSKRFALIEIRLLVRLRNSSVCYLSLFQSQYLPVRILSEIMIHIVLIIRSDIKISDIDNTSSFTTNVIVTRIETVDWRWTEWID